MENTFIEHMVRRDDKQSRIIKKVGIIVGLLVINVLALNFLTMFYSIVIGASAIFLFLFWRRIGQEFEYIYTDGLIDIDVIYGQSSRKRLLSVDAKNFLVIAPADSKTHQREIEAKYDKTIDAGSGKINEKSYVGIVKVEDKTIKLIFEPNDRIITALKRYIPRKFEARV
ncbi:MAG: hypothetical protein IJ315_03005 [Firmicutes bacterium]|nr:hypothetical protein [Bacillota bacterium]